MEDLEFMKHVYDVGVEAMGADDPMTRLLVLALAMTKSIIGAEQFEAMDDERRQKLVIVAACHIVDNIK